jgi:hypothetical protein
MNSPFCHPSYPNIQFVVFVSKHISLLMNSLIEFNPLNAELNAFRHLLTLVGAHHILHVSRVRVKPNH